MDDNEDASGLSRRAVLGIGALTAGAVAAGPLIGAQAASAAVRPAALPKAPRGSTLSHTLLHGEPDAAGYRPIVRGAGEPSLVRDDLFTGTSSGRRTRQALLAFGQLTDIHVVDAQSPARVEFLDRFNDPDSPVVSVAPFSAAYRPWEMLSAHVAEAMVRAVNRLDGGPVTRRPLDFTISTGDNSDNTQYNEVRWHIDLLDGGRTVRPDSGDYSKWEGVGGDDDLDTAYWHPEGTPPLGTEDKYRATYGYPTAPGLLDRCRRPFTSTGLSTPWFSVFGNHDGLIEGNIPSDAAINAVATGSLKVIGLPDGVNVAELLAELAAGDFAAIEQLLSDGPAKTVTADANRRTLSLTEHVSEYFTTVGAPVGHGYTQQNIDDQTAYYAFTAGPVRCIVLDTVNPNGYDDGSIDSTQLTWLTSELNTHSSRHLDNSGAWVAGTGTDALMLIFSHHTIATMENVIGTDRVNGTTVADLLLQYPNVVAWVNGHTHVNSLMPHARSADAAVGGGFWEINSASHIDWPQQSRIVELVDNGDGTLSIFTTVIDHAARVARPAKPSSPLDLASLSRELAVNDPQRDPETATVDGKRGAVTDRNTELRLAMPFVLG